MADEFIGRATAQDGTPDNTAPGMKVQPGQMQGSVFADGSNIAAADAHRAAQEAEAPRDKTSIRTDGGTHRFTEHADGRVEQRQERIIKSDSSPATTGSVLDGARSQDGQPQMRSQVTGDSLVTYKNVEVTVDFLESQGLVTRNPDGSYTSFGQGDAATTPATSPSTEQANVTNEQAPEQAPADIDPTNPDRAIRQEWASKVQDALKRDGHVAGDLFEEAVALWQDGPGVVDASSPRIAELLGTNSEAVLNSLQEYHANEAAWIAGKHGVTDMEGFVQFVQSKPGAMREAITRAVLEGDVNAAWGGLAREFARDVQAAAPEFEAADIMGADVAPGIRTFQVDGEPWVEVSPLKPGGETFRGSVREAVKRNVIRVSAT